jgi:hypothetical protein
VSDNIYPYFRDGKGLRCHAIAQRLQRRADIHVFTARWKESSRTPKEGQLTFRAVSRLPPMYFGDSRSLREAIFAADSCWQLLRLAFDIRKHDQSSYSHTSLLRVVAWLKQKWRNTAEMSPLIKSADARNMGILHVCPSWSRPLTLRLRPLTWRDAKGS